MLGFWWPCPVLMVQPHKAPVWKAWAVTTSPVTFLSPFQPCLRPCLGKREGSGFRKANFLPEVWNLKKRRPSTRGTKQSGWVSPELSASVLMGEKQRSPTRIQNMTIAF